MTEINKDTTIRVRVDSKLIHADVHGCHHRFFSILDPDWEEGMDPKLKWTKVFIKSKGSAGLSKIAMKSRWVVLHGKWRIWEWQKVGKVFVAANIEGISYEHVAPKATEFSFELEPVLEF